MMEIKRSTLGTVFFVILAIVHLNSFREAFSLLLDPDVSYSLWDLVADLAQVLVFFIYLIMLFVAFKSNFSRFAAATIVFISFALNAFAFVHSLSNGSFKTLLSESLVLLDVPVIIILCLRIEHRANKWLPFYGIPEVGL